MSCTSHSNRPARVAFESTSVRRELRLQIPHGLLHSVATHETVCTSASVGVARTVRTATRWGLGTEPQGACTALSPAGWQSLTFLTARHAPNLTAVPAWGVPALCLVSSTRTRDQAATGQVTLLIRDTCQRDSTERGASFENTISRIAPRRERTPSAYSSGYI